MSEPDPVLETPDLPAYIGETIAHKYLLKRVVAFGGMGVVYEAHHLDLDQRVAIKLVRTELTDNDDVLSRFWTEARACAGLRSAHVASVLDFGRGADGQPYLVMEYLEGKDLAQILEERGPLPIGEAVSYIRQACEGLSEAHACGVIHRDVKAENLFLSQNAAGRCTLKLLDFGICKRAERFSRRSLTEPGTSVGSPCSMSPEQMRDPSSVDERTDVWALGAVLFELLTGTPPFDGDGVPQICARVMSDPAPRLGQVREDVPPELERIVAACLEKDRERRIQSADELSDLLAPFDPRVSNPPAPRRTTPIETLSVPPTWAAKNESRITHIPGVPRRRWGARALAATMLALAVVTAAWARSPAQVQRLAGIDSYLAARPCGVGQALTNALLQRARASGLGREDGATAAVPAMVDLPSVSDEAAERADPTSMTRRSKTPATTARARPMPSPPPPSVNPTPERAKTVDEPGEGAKPAVPTTPAEPQGRAPTSTLPPEISSALSSAETSPAQEADD